MNINITTPALLFSAITLLMLAYTNRFSVLGNLVRQLHSMYSESPSRKLYNQIRNFRKRLKLIKNMQFSGVLSFFLCVLCMLLIFAGKSVAANIVFVSSLLLLMLSLIFSMIEIYMSIYALEVQLSDIEGIQDKQDN